MSLRWKLSKLNYIFRRVSFVDFDGRDGGLALFWNDQIDVNILFASLHHIASYS